MRHQRDHGLGNEPAEADECGPQETGAQLDWPDKRNELPRVVGHDRNCVSDAAQDERSGAKRLLQERVARQVARSPREHDAQANDRQ